MNYFPFHVGDYASATRHLSWDEDAAYRRMLDWYYTTEKPLPIDLRAVCRLVLATTDSQREAVQVVLSEFFELTEAGWVNRRADAEIDSMRLKQAHSAAKDAHETERMRRHRERRASMFEALRAVEIIPAWDVPMKELQRLIDTHCNANSNEPATGLQREQAISGDAPATAIFTNTNTNTNTNTSIKEERAPRKRSAPTLMVDCPDDVDPQIWQDWHKLRMAKRAPVTDTVVAGARSEAVKADMTLEDFLSVWCRRGSQGLEASWLKPEERINGKQNAKPRVYHDISGMDYTKGVTHDGRF